MFFGNWEITAGGIAWSSRGVHHYLIPRESLTAERIESADTRFYDWILKATAEDWLTENDLYDLNFAFVYAIAQFGLPFSYDIFDATLEEQFEILEEDEEE